MKAWFSNVPNAISLSRIVAVPVLLGAAATGRHDLFAYVLLYAMVSDIVDGFLARSLHLESEFGARLDSVADLGTVAASIAGLVAFERPFLASHPYSVGVFVFALSFEIGFALWRYGRVSSFHTYLSRAAAYAMGIFIMDLFLIGFHVWVVLPRAHDCAAVLLGGDCAGRLSTRVAGRCPRAVLGLEVARADLTRRAGAGEIPTWFSAAELAVGRMRHSAPWPPTLPQIHVGFFMLVGDPRASHVKR